MNKPCPCGSGSTYTHCCEPYIENKKPAPTAEALMRSRYSAYTLARTDYIQRTMQDKAARGFDPIDAKRWAQSVEWLGLTVFEHKKLDNHQATVTFAARFKAQNKIQFVYEISIFKRHDGQWFYTDGQQLDLPSSKQDCLCGSGKRFKRCCGK